MIKIGMSIPSTVADVDIATLRQWIAAIDQGPFSRLATGERIASPFLDLQCVLSAAAVLTERVPIQSLIAVTPYHEEVLVAKQAATIDVLSSGRFTLGVGVGMREYDYALMNKQAHFKSRLARLDKQIKTIKDIWSGDFEFPDAPKIGPAPIQAGGPKIFSSSLGPKSMARAVQWADGLAGFNLTGDMAELKKIYQRFLSLWQDSGRKGKPWMQVALWFSLGDQAETQLKDFAMDYMKIFGDDYAKKTANLCWLNSNEHIKQAIEQLEAIGYDEVILTPTTGDITELDRACELVASL